MHGSAAVGWLLTALCAFVAGVCLVRARGAGGIRRRTARSEALMGLGMAAMALSGSVSTALPPLVFLLLFGAVGAWELRLLRETGHVHHVHHLVGALAMIYMALAMPGSHAAAAGAHAAGAAAAGLPLLTGALLAYYAGYVLRTGLLLLPAPAGGEPDGAGANGRGTDAAAAAGADCAVHGHGVPGLTPACRVAMGTGMLTMLLML
jgi:hypothetical protein